MQKLVVLYIFLLCTLISVSAADRVNINDATMESLEKIKQLKLIDRIRILKYLKENRRFSSTRELVRSNVIDEATFEKIKDQISLSDEPVQRTAPKIDPHEKININTASISQFEVLKELSFIDKVRIIKHRNKYGFFRSADELVKKGIIKQDILAQIRNKIKVSDVEVETTDSFNFSKLSFNVDKSNLKIRTEQKTKSPASKMFRSIVQMIKIENYEYASEKLKLFIKEYKDSEFLDDSYYLLGSCYENRKEFEHAVKEYKTIHDNFFSSDIRHIAILRMAICFDSMKNYGHSLQYYKKFLDISGGSEYSEMVKKRIKELHK